MIKLTDKLAVTADDECYIVGKPKARAGRGVELRNPSYYATLAQAACAALSRALRAGVQDGSITTLREFLQEEKRLTAEFSEKLKPLEL